MLRFAVEGAPAAWYQGQEHDGGSSMFALPRRPEVAPRATPQPDAAIANEVLR